MQTFILYLLITWIAFSMGFVFGAAWCGFCKKNKAIEWLFGGPKSRQVIHPAMDK